MKNLILVSALLALLTATPVLASEITGSLSSGASGSGTTSGSGGSLTGTVNGGSGTLSGTVGGGSLSGTVVGGGSGGGGSSGGGGGDGNGSGSSGLPLPSSGGGIVLGTSTDSGTGATDPGTVLGTSTGVPNTGEGGNATGVLLIIAGLSLVTGLGAYRFSRKALR